jgi:excisionase family DNA binding protein
MTKDRTKADSLPAMLTLAEVAQELRLAARTLRDPTWRTRLRAVKVGKQWLVARDTIEAILRGPR